MNELEKNIGNLSSSSFSWSCECVLILIADTANIIMSQNVILFWIWMTHGSSDWMDESGEPRFEKRKGKQFVKCLFKARPLAHPCRQPGQLSWVLLCSLSCWTLCLLKNNKMKKSLADFNFDTFIDLEKLMKKLLANVYF